MSFRCPECLDPTALKITAGIELPPDNRSDEITLQIITCAACGFTGLAVYQESRRGSFGRESFEHVGYYAPASQVAALQQMLTCCPDAGNRWCRCPAHHTLATRDTAGRWNGLDMLRCEKPFKLRLSPD